MNNDVIRVRRILVALDASGLEPTHLETASLLARRLRATIRGLFVEDINLLRLAALPFSTQIDLQTGGRQPFETRDLERQMQSLAVIAQQRLAEAAKRQSIEWSFDTVRGAVAQEIAAAAENADLVILEGAHRNMPPYLRLGRTANAAIRQVSQPTLVLRSGNRIEGPALVVFDGSPTSEKALKMAINLTIDGDPLTVAIPVRAGSNYEGLKDSAQTIIGNDHVTAQYLPSTAQSFAELCAFVHRRNCGLVVLTAEDPLLSVDDVAAMLESLDCPALLVR